MKNISNYILGLLGALFFALGALVFRPRQRKILKPVTLRDPAPAESALAKAQTAAIKRAADGSKDGKSLVDFYSSRTGRTREGN